MRMKAGRELDAKVAVEVMGWHKDERPGYYHWLNEEGGETGYDWLEKPIKPFDPSTDIAAAWEVLEKLKEMGFYCELFDMRHGCYTLDSKGPRFVGWKVEICDLEDTEEMGPMPVDHSEDWTAFAETAPLALCLAALKAMETK